MLILATRLLLLVVMQKAGFMLVEISFARSPEERRYVVVLVSLYHSVIHCGIAIFFFNRNIKMLLPVPLDSFSLALMPYLNIWSAMSGSLESLIQTCGFLK